MKHLLKMSDLSPAELHHILDVAEKLKAEQKAGMTPALLKGRSVALMFSLRKPGSSTSSSQLFSPSRTSVFIRRPARLPKSLS